MIPKRIQLQRTAGWTKPPNTVVCSRPSKWGNPFRLVPCPEPNKCGRFVVIGPNCNTVCVPKAEAVEYAIERFRKTLELRLLKVTPHQVREELRGKNLACWCRTTEPCHVDVLLEIANSMRRVDAISNTSDLKRAEMCDDICELAQQWADAPSKQSESAESFMQRICVVLGTSWDGDES